jgi:hypothetical protein
MNRKRMPRLKHKPLAIEALEQRTLLAANPLPLANVAVIDDDYENNDTLQTAYNFGLVSGVHIFDGLRLTDSSDFYRFNTGATGGALHKIEVRFTHSQGDIDVVLYNDQLQVIATAIGAANNETISLTGRPGDFYWMRVYGKNGATNPNYSIKVFAPITPDDAYEENDSRLTAYDLGTMSSERTIRNLRMVDSQDWYSFTTSAVGRSVDYAQITFQHTQGDLNLELYNTSGQRITSSLGTSNREAVSLEGLAAGKYFLRVMGNRGAINSLYTLLITAPAVPPPVVSNFNIDLQFTGLTNTQRAIFQQAAQRWQQIITGDLPSATYGAAVIDDIVITAASVNIDGPGQVLGRAGPTRLRNGSFLPFYGMMEFDSADMASMEQSGRLYNVILHEMGHVLGIGTIWQAKGLLTGIGTSTPRFTGPQATAQFNAIFGRNDPGVLVESDGGPGTANAHWEESLFKTELMTGFIGSETLTPLSRVTVASLADLGYTVNIAAADAFTPSLIAPSINLLSSSSSSQLSSSALAYSTSTIDVTSSMFIQQPRSSPLPRAVIPQGISSVSSWPTEPMKKGKEVDAEIEAILDLLF